MKNNINNLHLGGHGNKTHIDEGALVFLINKFKIKSFLDIGCGPLGMVELAKNKGLESFGIDGDSNIPDNQYLLRHDFTQKEFSFGKNFDLAWSVEFLEHVHEKYISNYMNAFSCCQFAFITHALPGKKGYHHVNCQSPEYWVDVFNKYGFIIDLETTNDVRKYSTMNREFVKNTGKFFIKKDSCSLHV